jgi:hypothetical protein
MPWKQELCWQQSRVSEIYSLNESSVRRTCDPRHCNYGLTHRNVSATFTVS